MALHVDRFDLTLEDGQNAFRNQRAYPSDLILALLCEQVTKQRDVGTIVRLEVGAPSQGESPEEWIVIRNAVKNIPWYQMLFATGYIGAAYYNKRYSNIVIAFKGTSPATNYTDFLKEIADDLRISFSRIPRNLLPAYEFTRQIFQEFQGKVLSICLTGHSLGGFLASTSAIYMKHPHLVAEAGNTSHHTHTVVFDCPGSKYIFQKHFFRQQRRLDGRNFVDLDLTCYLLNPNLINSWNEQLGTLLYLPDAGFHYISNIIEALREYRTRIEILDWPYGGLETFRTRLTATFSRMDPNVLRKIIPFHFQQLPRHSCKITAFSEGERVFLNTVYSLMDQTPSIAQQMSFKFNNMEQLLEVFGVFTMNHATDSVSLKNENDERNSIDYFVTVVKCLDWNHNSMMDILTPFLYQSGARIELVQFGFDSEFESIERAIRGHFEYGAKESGECRSLVQITTGTEDTFVPAIYIYHMTKRIATELGKRVAMVSTKRLSSILRFLFETPNSLPSLDVLIVDCNARNSQEASEFLQLVSLGHSPERLVLFLSTHPPSTSIQQIRISESCQLPAFTYADLTVRSQNIIRQCTQFVLQGHTVHQGCLPQTVCNILSTDCLKSIHNGDPLRVGQPLQEMELFDKQHYMVRTFRKVLLLTESVGSLSTSVGKGRDTMLVFSGTVPPQFPSSSSHELSVFEGLNEDNVLTFVESASRIALLDTRVDPVCVFRKLCNVHGRNMKGIHWFKNDEEFSGQFIWQMSFGDTSEIRVASDHCSQKEFTEKGIKIPSYSEEEMLSFPNPFVLLLDEPGMGKSVSMRQLAAKTKSYNPETWTIFIDLNTHAKLLRSFNWDWDSLLSIFTQLEQLNNFGQSLFREYLTTPQKVVIFLDGFDEIDVESGNRTVKLCQWLIQNTQAKLYVAARSHSEGVLTRQLGSFPHRLNKFGNAERREYFYKYWTHHHEFINAKHTAPLEPGTDFHAAIMKFIDFLMQDIEFISDAEFIGVPLQLFMFATIYFDDFLRFCDQFVKGELPQVITQKTVKFKRIPDMLHLYDLFTRAKYDICMEEKCHYPRLASWDYRELTSGYKALHTRAAFNYIYPSERYERIGHWTGGGLDDLDWHKLKSIGIVKANEDEQGPEVVSGFSPFIHRSLAEYFVADLITQRLQNESTRACTIEFLQERNADSIPRFFQAEFEKMRYFIDHILIYGQRDAEFRTHLIDMVRWYPWNERVPIPKISKVDELGRTILHYAASYGDWTRYGIIGLILRNRNLLTQPDVFAHYFMDYLLISKEYIHGAEEHMERLMLYNIPEETITKDVESLEFQEPMAKVIKHILMNKETWFLYWFLGDFQLERNLNDLKSEIERKAKELQGAGQWTPEEFAELDDKSLVSLSKGWSYCLELLTMRNLLRGGIISDSLEPYQLRQLQ